MCVCVCVYIYIYIYIYTHTYTHLFFPFIYFQISYICSLVSTILFLNLFLLFQINTCLCFLKMVKRDYNGKQCSYLPILILSCSLEPIFDFLVIVMTIKASTTIPWFILHIICQIHAVKNDCSLTLFSVLTKLHYAISFSYSFENLNSLISANKVSRTISPTHKHRASD